MRNSLLLVLALLMGLALGCKKETAGIPDQKPNPPYNPSANANTTNSPIGRVGGGSTAPEEGEEESTDAEESSDASANPPGENATAESQPAKPAAPPNPFKRRQLPSLGRAGGGVTADDASDPVETPPATVEEETPPPTTDDNATTASNDTPAVSEPQQPERRSFFDRAVIAFKNEHEHEAFQFLYAHALTDDGALRDHPVAYYPGIKAPRLGLRWAVGIEYDDGGVEGDPPVIGDPADTSSDTASDSGFGGGNDTGVSNRGGGVRGLSGASRNRNFNRGSGGGNTNTTPANVPEPPGEQLVYYTGEFGSKLVNRFEMRRTRAYFGEALQDVDLDATFDEPDQPGQQASTPPPSTAAGGDYAISGGNSTRDSRPGRNRNRNSDSDDDEPDYTADATSLAPGVLMLGVNRTDKLIEDAKASGVDMLIIFEVSVKERNQKVSSSTIARMYALTSEGEFEQIAKTKTLNTTAVANAREKGGEPVEEELDKLFAGLVDEEYRATDMPEVLDSEIAAKRVNWLLEQEVSNPLPTMVEIKNYHEMGLLTRADVANAFEQLIGADATQDLIDGDIEAKENALAKWLPGRFRASTSGNFR